MDRSRSTTTPATSTSWSTCWGGSRRRPPTTRWCRHACSTRRTGIIDRRVSRRDVADRRPARWSTGGCDRSRPQRDRHQSCGAVVPHGLAERNRPTAGLQPQLRRPARLCRTWSIVELGPNGKISLFTPANADVVIDVLGWFPATGSFSGLVPARLMDTRGGIVVTADPWHVVAVADRRQHHRRDGARRRRQPEEDVRRRHVHDRRRHHPTAARQGHLRRVLRRDWQLGELPPRCAASYPPSVLGNALGGYPERTPRRHPPDLCAAADHGCPLRPRQGARVATASNPTSTTPTAATTPASR